MADDYFGAELALDPATGNSVGNAVATVYAIDDTSFATPLTITDMSDVPLANLVASPNGIYPPFKVVGGITSVMAVSGGLVTPLTSKLGMKGEAGGPGPAGEGVPPLESGAAGMVVTHAGGAAVWQQQNAGIAGAPVAWPSTFPAAQHSHTAAEVSDASSIGRAVLRAVTMQEAREALGAGTGNGTSNLALGTTATTAAPGNHGHAATAIAFTPTGSITATNLQEAVAQAAATGSGAGSSNVLVWRYASGAYPTLPTTKPAGIEVVQAYGPVQPTTVPSWIGTGSGQALGKYEYTALT